MGGDARLLLLLLASSAAAKQLLPTSTIFDSSQVGNVTCFRIPSIVWTPTALLAFAEARVHSCGDCVVNGIAMRRSTDSGQSWDEIQYPVPATRTDPTDPNSDVGGNPAAVYDSTTKTVILQFCRGKKDGSTCSPAKSNWQVTSDDDGRTWTSARDISSSFGKFAGVQPGPGTGVQLRYNKVHAGRLVFAGHYGVYDAVVVWYSDDGGKTYIRSNNSNSVFSKMDEVQPAETGNGSVILTMRTQQSHSFKNSCDCKAMARSDDGGVNFGALYYDHDLISPICEAGFANINGQLYFSNPNSRRLRQDLTLRRSADSFTGKQWSASLLVSSGPADYSAIVQEPLTHFPTEGGIIWGQCQSPLGVEPVFCQALNANWMTYFSRFNLSFSGPLTVAVA